MSKSKSYKDLYKEAMNAGMVEQISYEYFKWEEEGQELVGKYLGCETVQSDKFENPFIRHLFDTDAGLLAVVCGAVIDKLLEGDTYLQKVLAITFTGKQDMQDGRSYNSYIVKIVD